MYGLIKIIIFVFNTEGVLIFILNMDAKFECGTSMILFEFGNDLISSLKHVLDPSVEINLFLYPVIGF